ncbi:MAG: hypothetical protein QM740_19825 [Acidovorax sp.]
MSRIDSASTYSLAGWLGRLGRVRTIATVFALGFLLAKSCSSCAAVHRRRAANRSADKPHNLQRWEGEGGRNEPPVGGDITK